MSKGRLVAETYQVVPSISTATLAVMLVGCVVGAILAEKVSPEDPAISMEGKDKPDEPESEVVVA